MPKPRKQQVSLDATSFYHCTARCVRRAFLCGIDKLTGKSFEHRRYWIEERLLLLSKVFCIDLCAYSVMSNHLHVVLHVNKSHALGLSDKAICQRWHQLYKGTPLTQRFVEGKLLSKAEQQAVTEKVEQWRINLYSISWFMRSLNEPIARWANAEDECTGKFWESRFNSQALLDESALLACMAYVDLNPIRAQQAESLETSQYTSIYRRIHYHSRYKAQPLDIANFKSTRAIKEEFQLPFSWQDYYKLVEWTGRALRNDKPGYLKSDKPFLLEAINLQPDHWMSITQQLETSFKCLVGTATSLRNLAPLLGYRRPPGITNATNLFH